jgi:hypothetical protein
MLSPFLGMDPYLEDPAFWQDFHRTFINYWREAIADQLPENYEASVGEQVYLVEEPPEPRKLVGPDVALTQDAAFPIREPSSSGAVATLEPVTIPVLILDEPTNPYIEILHRPDRSLVGVLELLSPANKEEPGRRALGQKVHLVELDLLLRGRRLPLERPLPEADYFYFLCRSDGRPDCQVYHWGLRDRLPVLPVPLQSPDPDLLIDLQAVFNTSYERGRFARRLLYANSPPVRRSQEEQEWVREKIATIKT